VTDPGVIGFPVFGLAEPALGPRWLSMFGPGSGSEVQGVTLTNGPVGVKGDRWVDVTSAIRQSPSSGWSASASEWDWYNTGLDVLNRGDIDYRSAAGNAWRQLADDFNADYESHFQIWSHHTWIVDGATLPARSIAIGDDWVALCVDHPDVLILAQGAGVAPDQIVLASTTGDGYGVDLLKPLHFPASVIASRNSART
jgi:hypothetical protein